MGRMPSPAIVMGMMEPVETIRFEKTEGGATRHCFVEVFDDGNAGLHEDDTYHIIEWADDCRALAISKAESLGYRRVNRPGIP